MSIQVSANVEMNNALLTANSDFFTPILDKVASLEPSLAWVEALRQQALTGTSEFALPTRRDEEWRFTNLSALAETQFGVLAADAVETQAFSADGDRVAPFVFPEMTQTRLVFVNGVYAPGLSNLEGLPTGIYVGHLPESPAAVQTYLGKLPGLAEVFSALNSASFVDAAVVVVPKNQVVEAPIHLLFIATDSSQPVIHQPRCLVVAESGSRLTLVEHYVAAAVANIPSCLDARTKFPYFTNTVTEIAIAPNAEVNHTRIQREAGNAFHIGKTTVTQGRDSRYTCNAITLGAKLSRHNLEVFQQGEGTQTNLNGLTMIGGEQVADTHSAIAYNHPNGSSDQLHKCIVDGKAHAVFNGKVFVPKPAQLTDAAQLNRNLLLSNKGRVDTKPQLEITADNVKCTHGATVGQLEEEEVFYLQSRGLDAYTSRNLLVDAFAAEILNRIPVRSLQSLLSRCIACRAN
ncbi:MAG: Fe-S cluster assembly protein SufD [Desertifilum sp. SIO1I2]|nr:Fe-S cluster assembly protein SufD [Desertifilum sp. SIO1I2]